MDTVLVSCVHQTNEDSVGVGLFYSSVCVSSEAHIVLYGT